MYHPPPAHRTHIHKSSSQSSMHSSSHHPHSHSLPESSPAMASLHPPQPTTSSWGPGLTTKRPGYSSSVLDRDREREREGKMMRMDWTSELGARDRDPEGSRISSGRVPNG